MEQSKLISGVIAKLKIAYPKYFKDLLTGLTPTEQAEQLVGLTKLYQDKLGTYNPKVVLNAIDKIITTSRFMPTIAEILDECKRAEKNEFKETVKCMIDGGYFGSQREIEKTYHFIDEGVIPNWLLEDMKNYQTVAITTDTKLLGGNV